MFPISNEQAQDGSNPRLFVEKQTIVVCSLQPQRAPGPDLTNKLTRLSARGPGKGSLMCVVSTVTPPVNTMETNL